MALLTQHSGVYCVMKITVAEHNPEMALLTQYTFCFSFDLLALDGNVSVWSYGTCTFVCVCVCVCVLYIVSCHNYMYYVCKT